MNKVVVTGSESTGKTELAARLGRHFGVPVSEEFVRAFARQRPGQPIGFEDHGAIARGQVAAEDAAIGRASHLVILDTDLVSTVVYSEHYFGRCPAWIVEEARRRAGDLYLLLAPDVPWIPDGVRDRGDRREEMHALFEGRLRDFGLRWITIRGDWDARFTMARDAVAALQSPG